MFRVPTRNQSTRSPVQASSPVSIRVGVHNRVLYYSNRCLLRDSGLVSDDHVFGPDRECFMCKAPTRWTHPVEKSRQSFRKWGKGYTMRPVWSFCGQCEDFYQAAQDDKLFEAMAHWQERPPTEVEDDLRETFAAFRLADLGPVPYEQPDASQ